MFLFQFLSRDISYSMENLAIDTVVCMYESWLNNHFSLHHSIIFFLNGWENLQYELGIEKVKELTSASCPRQISAMTKARNTLIALGGHCGYTSELIRVSWINEKEMGQQSHSIPTMRNRRNWVGKVHKFNQIKTNHHSFGRQWGLCSILIEIKDAKTNKQDTHSN